MGLLYKLESASRLIGKTIIVKKLNGNSIEGLLLSINTNSIVVKRDSNNLIIAKISIDSILRSNEGIK